MFIELSDGEVINTDHIVRIGKTSVASLRRIYFSDSDYKEVKNDDVAKILGCIKQAAKAVCAIDGVFFSAGCDGRVYVSQCQGKDKPIFTTESQPVKTE